MKKILTTTAIFIAFLLTLVTVIVGLRLPENVLTLIAGGILISIILVAGACIWYVKLMAQINVGIRKAEKRIKEAEAYRAEHEAIQDGYGMLHLINHLTGHSQNLTLDARTYRNGHAEPSKPEEMETLRLILAARHASTSKLMLTEPMVVENPSAPLDLLALIDEHPHTDIWGKTGSGKTTLLRIIGHRRKASGHYVIVLDSSEHPAKWTGLDRVQALDKQIEVIGKLFAIHQANGEALAAGRAIESDFDQYTILSDEWTDIIRALDEQSNLIGRQFIDEMSRKARKTGIHCVFSTQTNLAADLGLDGRYRVVRNFLQLEIVNLPDDSYIARAVIAGYKLGEYPIPTPPPLPPMISQGYIAPTLETVTPDLVFDSGENIARVEREDADAKFVRLVHGGMSRNAASREAYQRPYAGDLVDRGKRLLGEI